MRNPMTDLLLEPPLSLPSLLSTLLLEPDEADGDTANRDGRQFTNKDEDNFGRFIPMILIATTIVVKVRNPDFYYMTLLTTP